MLSSFNHKFTDLEYFLLESLVKYLFEFLVQSMKVIKMEGAENTLIVGIYRMLETVVSELKLMLVLHEVDNKSICKQINGIQ